MNTKQFISACKGKGVNVKSVKLNKRLTVISYNYDLPQKRVSQTHSTNFYHLGDNRLQAIYNEHFANADKLVRF